MGKLSELERELISAYLDDALEGSELQQVEQLLSQNADAALWLSQLTKMRASLKALETTKNLSGLAERVIAEARRVAAQEGLSAEHHVRRGNAQVRPLGPGATKPATSAPQARSEQGGWWMVAAALAASVLALAIIPGRQPPAINGIASIPTAIQPADVDEPITKQPVPEQPAENQLVDTSRRSPSELHQLQNAMQISLLYMIDVQMSEEAWNAGKFDQLLGQLGISGAEDFIADRDTLRTLIEQNMPGDPPQDDRAEVALMFIRSSATINDKLYVQLQSDKASYPGVKMMTTVVPETTNKIMTALQRSSRSGANKNYSRMIQLDDPQATIGGLVPQYEAAKQDPAEQQVGIDNLELRDTQAANIFGQSGDNIEADCIVILRKVKL